MSGLEDVIVLKGMDEMQKTRCCSVSIGGNVRFEVVVGVGDGDHLSEQILEGVFAYPPAMQLAFELLQPAWTVVDLGAHIGSFSLAASAMGCRVLAVEASPYNVRLLEASLVQNGFERMQVVPAAASDRHGTLEFMPAGPYGSVANPKMQLPITEVLAITVDQLLADLGWQHVDLVKLDIEGSEVAAIQGMPRLLGQADAPLVLYESNGHTLGLFEETPESLSAALSAHGYKSFQVTHGRLIPVSAGDLQPECNVDYLAMKQPLELPGGWQITDPLTLEETISRVLATCAHPHEHHRAYIAHALARADWRILADKGIRRALGRLNSDPHPDVRAAASWWQGRKPIVSRALGSLLSPLRARRHRRQRGSR